MPPRPVTRGRWTRKAGPPLLLLAGLLLPQLVLIGPALVGRKVLLDLPILALPGAYLPARPGHPYPPPHDRVLSDAVLQFEPYRVYAARAVRAGRLPLWSGSNYCGSPFLAANQTAVFSPYRLLDYLWPGPITIAWGQLAKALVAGVGAFLYFRRTLGLGRTAALIGGWCFPLCGFLVLWSSHPQSAVASWLPWVLLAADATARGRSRMAPLGLALATAAALLSGHAATGAHVLAAGGLQALFSLVDERRRADGGALTRGGLGVAAGFVLGVALSAPQTLPTLEYLRSSLRVAARAEGFVATPPVGLSALPQVVLPYYEGATRTGAVALRGVRQESAATAYAGFLLALVAGPLALLARRRSRLLLPAALALLGLAQVLDLPLLATALDSWPASALRNNRLTLFAGFGLLSLGALGLDALVAGARVRRRFALLAALPVAIAGLLSFQRALAPPAALDRALAGAGPAGALVRQWFVDMSAWGAALALLALGCWVLIARRSASRALVWLVGGLCLAELVVSALDVFPLSDPALYYPRLPVLTRLAAAPPGRICGVACLPPNLNQMAGLSDVRGYDGADPERIVDLLERLAQPGGPPSPEYARTLMLVPRVPSPLADLLGLRYLVYRGRPPAGVHPYLSGDDYFVLLNPKALPRTWVPRRAEVVADAAERLRRLTDPGFDPRGAALVEAPAGLPEALVQGGARGSARLIQDQDERVVIAAEMETEGLVVLSDRWDAGWRASVNGREAPVLRVDHALRGVVVPRGRSTVEMRYQPASLRLGLAAFAAALVLGALWAAWATRRAREPSRGPAADGDPPKPPGQ